MPVFWFYRSILFRHPDQVFDLEGSHYKMLYSAKYGAEIPRQARNDVLDGFQKSINNAHDSYNLNILIIILILNKYEPRGK